MNRYGNSGFGLFGMFFFVIFAMVMIGIGISAYLGLECYTSGNPNSMACYMISDRHEIGVRNR